MAAVLLIVEDSDSDYEAIVRALRKVGTDVSVLRAGDADTAVETIRRGVEGKGDPKPPEPTVVLLDLGLPDGDGREVLDEVKTSENLRQVPVVVFSSSTDPKTIAECYRRGAAGYLVKPFDFSRLEKIARSLKEYWLDSVALPGRGED